MRSAPKSPSALSIRFRLTNALDTINLYGTAPDSIVDGPGLRYAVFVQGCAHRCPGCHNPESQPAVGGTPTAISDVLADIRANKLITGVTLSGGEPFEQPAACATLARALKADGYNLWVYSGYLYEQLLARAEAEPAVAELLAIIDVLVDGPFVEGRKSYALKWRGSDNQRLIDVPRSQAEGRVVLWSNESYVPEKPPSW